jgi:hypothetical protein
MHSLPNQHQQYQQQPYAHPRRHRLHALHRRLLHPLHRHLLRFS